MGFRLSVLGITATVGPTVASLWSLLLWIREEAEGIREVKGTVLESLSPLSWRVLESLSWRLSWRVFPHSESFHHSGGHREGAEDPLFQASDSGSWTRF